MRRIQKRRPLYTGFYCSEGVFERIIGNKLLAPTAVASFLLLISNNRRVFIQRCACVCMYVYFDNRNIIKPLIRANDSIVSKISRPQTLRILGLNAYVPPSNKLAPRLQRITPTLLTSQLTNGYVPKPLFLATVLQLTRMTIIFTYASQSFVYKMTILHKC